MPLMSMPRIASATAARLVDRAGELDAAGLAAAADEHLGLDRRPCRHPSARKRSRRGACLVDGVGDLPGRDGQALGDEQRLGVGFLDLHGRARASGDGRDGRAMVPRRRPVRDRRWQRRRPPLRLPRRYNRAMAHRVTLIPGDGIGPELAEATTRVLDATGIGFEWEPVEAGEAAIAAHGTPLPDEVLESIRRNKVGLKGPITTPVGGGFRSVNVGSSPGARAVRQPPAGALDGRASSRATRTSTSSSSARTPRTSTPASSTWSAATPRRASRSSPARRRSGSPGSPSTTRSPTAGTRSRPSTRPTS